jgi:hypothetical protein
VSAGRTNIPPFPATTGYDLIPDLQAACFFSKRRADGQQRSSVWSAANPRRFSFPIRGSLRNESVPPQDQFMLVEGLTDQGSFRAKTDKKGKKGQKGLRVLFAPFCPSCPFLLFKRLPSSRPARE